MTVWNDLIIKMWHHCEFSRAPADAKKSPFETKQNQIAFFLLLHRSGEQVLLKADG